MKSTVDILEIVNRKVRLQDQFRDYSFERVVNSIKMSWSAILYLLGGIRTANRKDFGDVSSTVRQNMVELIDKNYLRVKEDLEQVKIQLAEDEKRELTEPELLECKKLKECVSKYEGELNESYNKLRKEITENFNSIIR